MNIAMTGATGYIGKHLSSYLTEKGGHRIIPLGRAMFREGMSGLLVQTLTHCDVIINLAGAPINQRWTPEHKQELFNSRITVTHRIIRALNAVKTKPKLMISASAVGYYPSLVESDEYTQTRGDGFLSDLCYAWEKEELRGVFNLVAPQSVSQLSFTRAMGKAYHAWTTFIVPQAVFRLLYGEAASFLTAGQNVRPTRLQEAGFHFSVPTIKKLFEGTDRHTVEHLDLERYMGLWYEIARYDHRFERGLTEVTATYILRPDGTIRVENRGCKRNSPYDICRTATGHAKIPDPAQPGKLKVSFFLNFYSDYYVLELDQENYNYALIGSSTDKYLWILSRTPQLPEEIKKKLVTAAERRGYDTSRLQWIEQLKK